MKNTHCHLEADYPRRYYYKALTKRSPAMIISKKRNLNIELLQFYALEDGGEGQLAVCLPLRREGGRSGDS